MMWRLAFWWHGWRYRRQARHLAGEVGPGYGYVPDQDFYGSMDLDAERGWVAGGPVPLPRIPYWPAPEVAHSGWWGQTAADLAPETLDAWGPSGPSASYEDWLADGINDPGPGAGSSLAFGPDQFRNEAPAVSGRSWGALGVAPQGGDRTVSWPGDEWPSIPGPAPDMGPDTSRLAWLDRQLEGHAEWARRMRGQVTGWGLEAAA